MFGGTVKLNRIGVVLICCTLGLLFYFYIQPFSTPTSINLKTLLIESVIAVQKGGFQVQTVYNTSLLNVQSKGKTKEGANNPVTDADLKSHYAITESLYSALGSRTIKIISEEHTPNEVPPSVQNIQVDNLANEMGQIPNDEIVDLKDVVVWVDPLDATQEFTESLVDYVTVMICITVKGSPLIGVIHKPFKHETEWAWVGKGTSPNLKVSLSTQTVQQHRIIVSRSHSGEVKEVVKNAFGSNVEITPAGGAGYKVLQVISGNADAYVHVTQIKKWDICAGDALLRAVGGQMTTLKGQFIRYSAEDDEINEDGLVAALHNYHTYFDALEHLQTT